MAYNSIVDESNSGEPSRFLRQLEFESNFSFVTNRQQQPVQIEPGTDIEIAKDGRVWAVMQRFFQSRGSWEDEKVSATALSTYLNCQVQFFFRYIAKIKEPEEVSENLEANQVGSVLHQVLEWFYQELAKSDPLVTASRIREKREDVPFLCRQALSKELFNRNDQLRNPNSMQQIILRIVEEYVDAILTHDENIAPFQIIELENKKDYKYRLPISVNGHEQLVTLYGIIDRVDEKDGVVRIVDYKTGGRDEVKFSYLEDIFERDGKRQNKALLQTLFYTFVYEQVRNIRNVEPNLYIIRKMKDQGTLFFNGGRNKVFLQAEHLEEMKGGFRTHLQALLEELFNPDIPFTHTTKAENCAFCPYTEICGK
jgi:hypothetical protein